MELFYGSFAHGLSPPRRTHMRQAGKGRLKPLLPTSISSKCHCPAQIPTLTHGLGYLPPCRSNKMLLGCYRQGVLASLPIKVAPDPSESLELESQDTMGLLIPLLALAAVCTGKYHFLLNSLQTTKGFSLGEGVGVGGLSLKSIQC